VQNYTLSGGTVQPHQMGRDLPHSTVYGAFAGRDGYFVLAAQVDDAWARLAPLIGGAELAADTRFHDLEGRNAHTPEIRRLIEAWAMAQPSVRDCLDQLNSVAVPCAKVQTIAEVVNDPLIIARNMIIEQDHPVLGRIRMPNLPFRFSECDTSPRWVAPALGEHHREVAAELGFSEPDR
jgi:crotonobetainyl-CoA:carnitine CoA-transferase CaiB-like acyl-CoA transferase